MKKTEIPMSPLAVASTILFVGVLISLSIIFGARSVNYAYAVECDSASPLSRDCLIKYAQDLKLNSRDFVSCIDDRLTKDEVEKGSKLAESLNLSGTPTYFLGKNVNGTFNGFVVSWLDDAQVDELINYLKDNSLETAKEWLKTKQAAAVEKFKVQVRTYLQSPEGGSLTGEKLEAEFQKYIPTQEVLDEGLAVKSISLDGVEKEGSGPVYLYLFSDYQCPYCKKFYEDSMVNYQEKYINNGIMTYAFQDFPLDSLHPQARSAAEAARCAGRQGQYFKYHDALFKGQASLP